MNDKGGLSFSAVTSFDAAGGIDIEVKSFWTGNLDTSGAGDWWSILNSPEISEAEFSSQIDALVNDMKGCKGEIDGLNTAKEVFEQTNSQPFNKPDKISDLTKLYNQEKSCYDAAMRVDKAAIVSAIQDYNDKLHQLKEACKMNLCKMAAEKFNKDHQGTWVQDSSSYYGAGGHLEGHEEINYWGLVDAWSPFNDSLSELEGKLQAKNYMPYTYVGDDKYESTGVI